MKLNKRVVLLLVIVALLFAYNSLKANTAQQGQGYLPEITEPASGSQTLAFVSAAASNDLLFEYVPGAADTGWAQLAEFKRDRGFALTIR